MVIMVIRIPPTQQPQPLLPPPPTQQPQPQPQPLLPPPQQPQPLLPPPPLLLLLLSLLPLTHCAGGGGLNGRRYQGGA